MLPPPPQAFPLATHWLWSSNGFLNATRADALFGSGAIDFAGSGVVHMLGGISALLCTKMIKERIGRFDAEGYVSCAAGPACMPVCCHVCGVMMCIWRLDAEGYVSCAAGPACTLHACLCAVS
jgi:ammonia channel protein AmtB